MSLYDEKAIAGTRNCITSVPEQAAADATANVALAYFKENVTVTAAYYVPEAAISGVDTNTRHLNLQTSAAVEKANIDFISGVDGVAATRKAFSAITEFNVDAGGALILVSEKVGSGLALPAGLLVVEYRNRA